MKMHGIIVKENFKVRVPFYHYIFLFKNPVIKILKVVDCEGCVQENKLPLRGPGAKPTVAGQF